MSTAPIPFPAPHRPFGALLRRYREAARLSQEALAERAGTSARAIRYLERGSSRPFPDTLLRLAAALALSPGQHEALVAAAYAPAAPAALPLAAPPPPASSLVGRARELAVLRGRLAASLAGQGGLVLLSGEAGIGKTALAEALCADAQLHGALVLVGRCYDLSETPPYGPWTEARSQFPTSPDPPSLPNALHTAARSPQQFFTEVRTFFAAAAARQPLLLLLDDLQWADPASLDLLRFLARSLATLPLLLLVTYRPDVLDQRHPLAQLIPLLVRESRAERIALAPLSAVALHALIRQRYRLGVADETRLVAYLVRRTEGNALFVTEMLRALEERGTVVTAGGSLGDLEAVAVPALLRQVVEGRVARLGAAAEALLDVAAVVGQEVPLDVWARVAATDEGAVERVAERALAAGLFLEAQGGEQVGFAHALIREALYTGIPAPRRRRIHRAAGEVLAAVADAAPDAVAYHFQQAGDARAREWLMRAAWQAYHAFAHKTAGGRFEAVLPRTEGAERVRVLLALARLHRYREQGILYAEEAVDVARAAGEEVLTAVAQFRLGVTLGYHERIGEALRVVETAGASLDTLPDTAMVDWSELTGLMLSRSGRREDRAYLLAVCGRWRAARALLVDPPEQLSPKGKAAIARLGALLGHPDTIRAAIRDCVRLLAQSEDDLGILVMLILEGTLLLLPFLMDDEDARRRHEAAIAAGTQRAEEVLGTAPVLVGRCALLIVAGRWAEAQALWAQREEAFFSSLVVWDRAHVGGMARAQGKHDEAWALVREGLPAGPQTAPGAMYFATLDLYCLAARLALDAGDHAQARQWLAAHARWLAWAGEEVRWGRANGHLAWAEYHRATGDSLATLRHAEQALAEAAAPRQPLLLLAGQRLLGDLLGAAGRDDEARAHLEAALALADACGAPYERALTLLASAELQFATHDRDGARAALSQARELIEPLGAGPALARADALETRLEAMPAAARVSPAGLSAREVEVLRLVAQGLSNAQATEGDHHNPGGQATA